MVMRRIGGYVSAAYNALAANITSPGNTVRTSGVFRITDAAEALPNQMWSSDPYYDGVVLAMNSDNAPDGVGNSTFVDSSSNNFTATVVNTPGQGAGSPFAQPVGYWSGGFGPASSAASIYFTNAALAIGASADFTIEFWAMRTYVGSFNCVLCLGTSGQVVLRIDTNWTSTILSVASGTLNPATVAAPGKWFHYAVSRSGGTAYVHINGVQYASAANTTNVSLSGASAIIGNYNANTGQEWPGLISNLRVVSGTTVYTNGVNFTPPTSPLTAVSGTVLLTLQNNYFKDNSSNNIVPTINAGTNSPQAVASTPFPSQPNNYQPATTGAGCLFNGTSDYLTFADNNALDLGANNYTIEAWVYMNTSRAANTATIAGKYNITTGRSWSLQMGNGTVLFAQAAANNVVTSAASVALNQWYHVAVVRNGATVNVYINGESKGSAAAVSILNSTTAVSVGFSLDNAPATYYFPGIISNLRIVNGTAVYTSNFTPPTAPLTNITNTALLLNFANGAVIDKSGKNSFNATGNTEITTSNQKYGSGAIYFDGTTDCLVGNQSQLYTLGSQDFTFEAWLFPAKYPNSAVILDTRASNTSTTGIAMFITTTGLVSLNVNNATVLTTTASVPLVAWTHLALVKASNVYTIYINGVKPPSGSVTNTTTLSDPYITIGSSINQRAAATATDHYCGYMDDIRFTVGVARYTADFTPPVGTFAVQR